MSALWTVLFEYAQNEASASCTQDAEYRSNLSYSTEHTQWLRDHLSEEACRHLDDALEMSIAAMAIESEHLFQATLRLGLKLGSAQLER